MKKSTVLALGLICCMCVSAAFPDNKYTLANVKKDHGLYIFIESAPASEYETLGEVKKTGLVMTGSAKEMVKRLCNRAHNDYPTAEGIIFDDLALDHATVIKFK